MIDPVTGAVGAVADAVVSRLLTTATRQFKTGADAFLNPITFKDPAKPQFRNDFYKLLMWNKRYSRFLRGRGQELNKLVKWADGTGLQIAILSGAGGAGKSRLAAELAVKLVEERNFVAGTLKRGADNLPPRERPGNFAKSLLTIIDYAEERLEHVKAALERFANWGDDPGSGVRVLLLARSGQEEMLAAAIRRLDLADALMHLELPVLGPLPVEEALALANDVRSCLSGKEPFQEVAEEAFTESCRRWLEREDADETNRLPLHVMAAALHALERPDEGFTLSGNKLLKALAEREMRRASGISGGLGLGEHTLPRLIALATLAGGLGSGVLQRLKGTLLFDRLDVEAVRNTPWWDSERSMLAPLEPDRPAAAFVAEALLTGNGHDADALPQWLAVVLEGREESFCQRLPRLAYDIGAFSPDASKKLFAALEKMIEANPAAAQEFRAITEKEAHLAAPFAVAVGKALVELAKSDEEKAKHLNNLANHLSAAGKREEALKPAQEAVDIRRQLAEQNPEVFDPNLATSLNNLAAFLSELGRREEALKPAQEAVEIYRQLAEQNPQAFLPDLAMSLNNLAKILSELGRREEALKLAQEAVDIYRQLAEQNPQAFLPDLAMSLNNLAAFLSNLGRHEEVPELAQEAVDIYRQLAEQNPQAFLPDLAMSLNNLAAFLPELGRREEALKPAQEAVNIRRQLAEQNPQAFLPDLATSQGALGNVYIAMGRFDDAADAFGEGLRAIASPLRQLPAAHAPLAMVLLRDYLKACEKAGREPDEALAGPIVEVLQRVLREE